MWAVVISCLLQWNLAESQRSHFCKKNYTSLSSILKCEVFFIGMSEEPGTKVPQLFASCYPLILAVHSGLEHLQALLKVVITLHT